MTGIIYAYRNKINGKHYIGKTVDPIGRMGKHSRANSGSPMFNRAVKKYGIHSFSYEILIEAPEEDLNDWEIFFIWSLHSYTRGYNMTTGGDGMSSEVAKAQSINPSYLEKHSAGIARREQNQQYKNNHYSAMMALHSKPDYIKRRLDGLRAAMKTPKIQQILAEKNRRMAKPIFCSETRKQYSGAHSASVETGIDISSITKACRGVRAMAGGLHWRYATPEEVEKFRADQAKTKEVK